MEKEEQVTQELFSGLDSLLTATANAEGDIEIDTEGTTPTKTPDNTTTQTTTVSDKTDKTDFIEIPDNEVTKTNAVSTTDDNQTSTEQVPETKETALKQFATVLKTNNILSEDTNLEEFDGTLEGFKTLLENEKYNGATKLVEDYKETLPPVIKHIIDNYEDGVPLSDLINIKSNEIKYSSIDKDKLKDDTNLQKEIVKEFLKKTTNFSEEKINKTITRLEDVEELAGEAEESLPELIRLEQEREKKLKQEAKIQQENQRKQNEETLKSIKKSADDLKNKEIIPGIKLTDKDASNLYKTLTTPVGYDQNNRPIGKLEEMKSKDPIGFELRLAYMAELTKGFTDFSEILKRAKTLATKELEKATESVKIKTGKTIIEDEDTSNDLMKAASAFLSKF